MMRSKPAKTPFDSRSSTSCDFSTVSRSTASTSISAGQKLKRLLICGSIGLLPLLSQGCSTNNQFSGGTSVLIKSFSAKRQANMMAGSSQQQLASNRTASTPTRPLATSGRAAVPTSNTQLVAHNANAARPATPPTAQLPSQRTNPANNSLVAPVSYNAVSYGSDNSETAGGKEGRTLAQTVGFRRHVAANCQPGSDGGCNAGCATPSEFGCATCEPQRWDIDPQEFICDGGDRDPATIVREDWSAAGVDTTDTVMYYETLGGKVCVKPTNRTCVYAPRFGAVRQVTGAAFASNALAPGRVHLPQAAVGVLDRSTAGNVELAAKPIGQKQVQMLDRINDQQRHIPIDMVLPPTPIGTIVTPKINVDRTLVDESLGREWLELLDGRIEVVTLINPESLNVILSEQSAHFVSDAKQAAEVFLYETPDKCSMRITKTASHQMASPGDRIRFTIRFENMGSQKLGNAVILDSLSPRLSYVEGSQQCSVEADFSSQPNDSGSSILRWSITNPIEGQKGGVISFDCQVR